MFQAIRSNQRIAQIILAILIVPFAFFGMDAYFSDSPSTTDIATVGGTPIRVYEFEQALREQQEQMRNLAGGEIDRALLESEPFRRSVLDLLINRRVLALYAQDNRFAVVPQQIQQLILEVPQFQDNGSFSMERYNAILGAQGLSPAMFERQMAEQARFSQLSMAIADAGFVPLDTARRLLVAEQESRSVRELSLSSAAAGAAADISAAQIQAWYDEHPADFERPARIKADYVVFDRSAIEQQVKVDEAEVRAFYDGNPDRYGVAEQRRARHILFELAEDAGSGDVERLTAEADKLVAELRADPEKFAALAKEKSQDPGSAAAGGDLGFFGRGMMVKSFEEAVFALSEGEIADPVRSDFGIHIIQLTGIKPASMRSFDEVKDELEAELRTREAGRLFAEQAEHFANTVYEQPDTLEPIADELKLEIRHTDWLERSAGGLGGFANDKLINALFSDDAVKDGRNTEAVEVASNTLVAARVSEYEPAAKLALDEVKEQIEARLRREAGSKQVQARGEALLASLQQDAAAPLDDELSFADARSYRRSSAELSPTALRAVFAANSSTLPAHVGLIDEDGDYRIFRIESVERPQLAETDPSVQAAAEQFASLLARQDFEGFVASLRQRYAVQIKENLLRTEVDS